MHDKLRVGGVPEHFNLPWHLACEAGAFKDEGLDVEFVEIPGGTGAMCSELNSGNLDVAIILTEGAVNDILNGSNNRLVKVYTDSPLIWGIHVSQTSDIQSIEQVQNRKYAISRFGSGSHLMAIVDAAERNWPTENMDFQVIKNLDGAREALSSGSVDVFLWEKFMTQPLVDNGEFRRVGERRVPWPAFVASVRNDVLEHSAEKVKTALKVAQRYALKLMQKQDAPELFAKRFGLKLNDAQRWFEQTVWCDNFDFPESQLERVIAYLEKLKLIEKKNQTPADVWFHLTS